MIFKVWFRETLIIEMHSTQTMAINSTTARKESRSFSLFPALQLFYHVWSSTATFHFCLFLATWATRLGVWCSMTDGIRIRFPNQNFTSLINHAIRDCIFHSKEQDGKNYNIFIAHLEILVTIILLEQNNLQIYDW